jgi:acetolactate synthase-1/2/3 large subunit
MKISDYVMEYIASLGVDTVFCVTGGGAMHLNNSLGQSEKLKGVFMLHEQGASIAAEAYARIHEGYGACLVTSGPGATNAVTGCVGSYIDSIPVIYISGQAKRADLVGEQKIRQFGIQEVDIISIVKSYTKYAVQVDSPEKIKYELGKAAFLANDGRPGPVWIDLPLDIQASDVNPDSLESFIPEKKDYLVKASDIDKTIEAINKASKPVIVLGHGIRLSHSVSKARELIEYLGFPVFSSWNGVDLIESNHPLYYGRPGAVGQRAANLIEQGADLVITIGTRLNILSTGYNYDSFLSNAYHIMLDIDENEMNKKSVKPDLKVVADAASFINSLLGRKAEINKRDISKWITHCDELLKKYPVFTSDIKASEGLVSTYDLVKAVSDNMNGEDIYQFTSSGTSVDIAMKVFEIKKGQRAFLSSGLASMGYDIPCSIGSCVASGGRRTVCITGDGSIAMNIQELEVVKRLNLPIKIFVTDNSGYSMIYQSQTGNFGCLTGCTADDGLTLPDMGKVAEAFGIKSFLIDNPNNLEDIVKETLNYAGPSLCVVKTDITQKILPKQVNYMKEDGQMASRPIEDMGPLLDREELKEALYGV